MKLKLAAEIEFGKKNYMTIMADISILYKCMQNVRAKIFS